MLLIQSTQRVKLTVSLRADARNDKFSILSYPLRLDQCIKTIATTLEWHLAEM